MSVIRPLEEDDIPQVASLYQAVMRSGAATPTGLQPYLKRMFFDHPWADPAVPSLVYATEEGTILGFVGSYVRRLRFEGRPLRAACAGCFVTDPVARARGAGALLLRKFLAGMQDVTIADSASVPVRQIWERLGGTTAALQSIGWLRFFRPARFAGDYLLERSGRTSWQRAVHPVTSLGDAALQRLPRMRLEMRRPPTEGSQLSPQVLLEHLSAFTEGMRFRPDYDEAFLVWLFEEMSHVRRRGTLVRRLVSDHEGRILGWYVAYLRRGGVGQVLQIVARDRDVGAVVDHLFYEAWASGAAALRGRLEPLVFEAMSNRRCYLRHTARVLVHSRDPEIAKAIVLGQGMLTRMEGEWWMGHVGGSEHLPDVALAQLPDWNGGS